MAGAQLDIDVSQIAALAGVFERAKIETPRAIPRAVKRTGDSAYSRVVPTLTSQTGLKRKVIARAVVKQHGGMTYTLRSRGGDVSLKHFGARETRAGVSSAPWNARRVFAKTFIKGGLFPKRVGLVGGGHVFRRVGRGRLPVEKQKSGLFIPNEMVSGATREAFLSTVATVLPERLRHEMARILGGA